MALTSGHREFEVGDLAKRFAQRLYGAVKELLAEFSVGRKRVTDVTFRTEVI